MPVSQEALAVQSALQKSLQSLYDLNFKNRSFNSKANGKTWTKGSQSITFWPNAMDYKVEGKVRQVKWELINGKVSNITFPHPAYLEQLSDFLRQYLWGTE